MNYFNRYFFQGAAEALAISLLFPVCLLIGTFFLPITLAFIFAIPFAALSLFLVLGR